MYDSILAAVDGGAAAREAAERGVGLARRFGAVVRALSVVDPGGGEPNRRRAESAVDAVARLGAELDVEVETAVESGAPREIVAERAVRWGADLATAGASTATGLTRLRGGSVPETLLGRGVPALTARPVAGRPSAGGVAAEYDDVLLAVEGGGGSAAVDHALALARADGSTLHAVCAVDARLRVFSRDPERSCRRAVRTVAERAAGAGLDVESAVRSGVPADEVLRYAEGTDCDLLVQSGGGGGLAERLGGGLDGREIARRAAVPVLTVPE